MLRLFTSLRLDVSLVNCSTIASRLYCSTSDNANSRRKSLKGEDRSTVVSLDTSLRYLESSAYETTYGSQPVWFQYRRNHKGQIPPRKTRKKCIRKGVLSTGNPCPICRDEYLLLHEKNSKLLKQFLSEHTGQVLSYSVTGLCQHRHKELVVAIERAHDQGVLTYDVPFREYDYSDYYVTSEKH